MKYVIALFLLTLSLCCFCKNMAYPASWECFEINNFPYGTLCRIKTYAGWVVRLNSNSIAFVTDYDHQWTIKKLKMSGQN